MTSYATIGLSEYEIGLECDNKKLTIEILGACDEKDDFFPNIIATTAFEIMENDNCGYGDIIYNVIAEYISTSEMKHVYLMNPFLWNGFKTIELEERKIAWLLVVPISEQEKNYAIENGCTALENKFEEFNIDIFNLNRKSVI